jgi:hypothetical protein
VTGFERLDVTPDGYFHDCTACGWSIPRRGWRCDECGGLVHEDCPCACPIQVRRTEGKAPPVTRCGFCGLGNSDQLRTPFLDLSASCGRNDSRPCGRLAVSALEAT